VAARSGRLPGRSAFPLAFALLAVTWTPVIGASTVQLHRNAIFPELIDFGAVDLRSMLSSDGELRVVRLADGTDALDLVPRPEATLDLYLDEPVADWRAFDTLLVAVTVPESSAPLEANVSIRLRGGEVDHVYRAFMLSAGDAEMRIRLRELFDPAKAEVTAVVVYANPPYEGRRLRLRRIALEGQRQGY